MFLSLNHKKLDAYIVCKTFVSDCYKRTAGFPPEEKYALISQIRRAATSILLNIAEGSSRKSKADRTRFYEIARGSLVEIDAALIFHMT
jgi:four helix bundle protein